MLRKVLSFGLKLTACLSVIPTFAVAADVASQDAQGAAMQALTSFEAPSNTGHLLKAKPNGDTTTKGSVTTLAAASSLSQVFVYAVGSSNCGWEYMTSTSQFSTTCNHGGALMRSVVLEIGYGSNPLAWMVGSLLPSYTNYQTTPVCVVGGYYSWPCPSGYSVVGFLRYYNLDGNQGGLFRYQNTSTNSPWNTISTQINIL